MYSSEKINAFIKETPILKEVIDLQPVSWINPNRKNMKTMPAFSMKIEDMKAAGDLWNRFKPFFEEAFPETAKTGGVLESPLVELPKMKSVLSQHDSEVEGRLFLKCDNALPIVGSIKARGGFFEVLHYAEELALKEGLLKKEDNYKIFATNKFREFFSKYKIGVGSTGNLGLSIGTISAKLGFQVTVYVSADAKSWKKTLLRERGAEVVEFSGDFSEAILAGRKKTQADPMAYFVDDENSNELFLGYTVGALRLAKQLKEQGITVDKEHPLIVYSPCGVGGSPGGTAFGLKQIFGDNVHCFFVEPTHSPSVLVGLATGEMSNISVQDLGIDNRTEADGLAVGRASNFATNISNHIISGVYTIKDEDLFVLLSELMDSENIFLEPSATAGLIGPQMIAKTDYFEKNNVNLKNAIHVAWATGGDLVPDLEREKFYERGKKTSILF